MPRPVLTPFARLKRRILRELPKRKLVGDVVISSYEYTLLLDYLRNVYRGIVRGSFSACEEPVLSVALVQLGIKHYDGNYWSHFAQEVGVNAIPNQHRMVLSSCLTRTLNAQGKAMVEVGHFVKNVLLHGFVSHHYTDDLFNFLFAFYRLDLERDIARLDRDMMQSLMEVMTRDDNTGRTYLLKKQTAEAIIANPIGSKIRIRRLLRLIDNCFWNGLLPVNSLNRLSQCFIRWQENSADFSVEYGKYHGGGSEGSRAKSFSSPCLMHNASTGRFSLVLPTQLIRFEHDTEVYWRINAGENSRSVAVDLFQGVTGYRTGETAMDILPRDIFKDYDIELMSGENRLRRFRIASDCARFFSNSGLMILPRSLPTGDVYAFTLPEKLISSEALIDSVHASTLTLHYFEFEYGDVLRLPDGTPLSIGKRIEEGLLPRGRIAGAYGLNGEAEQLTLFSQPPSLLIRMSPTKSAGTRIIVMDKHFRLADETATIINLDDRSGETGYVISSRDYGCTVNGTYTLFVDVPNDRTTRYYEFALINGFNASFEDAPYTFVPRGTLRFADGLTVEHDPRTEKVPKENAYNFEIDASADAVEFVVEQLPVRLYVPVLKWQFDDANWQVEKPGEVWHSDFPRTICLKQLLRTILC